MRRNWSRETQTIARISRHSWLLRSIGQVASTTSARLFYKRGTATERHNDCLPSTVFDCARFSSVFSRVFVSEIFNLSGNAFLYETLYLHNTFIFGWNCSCINILVLFSDRYRVERPIWGVMVRFSACALELNEWLCCTAAFPPVSHS